MIETIQSLNYALALGGLLGIVIILFLILDIKYKKISETIIRAWGLQGAFLIVFFSSILTLVYSEVFGIIPCGFCWMERIALYPQVLLLATAIYLKDNGIARYGIVVSGFGLLVSLYHHYIQMGGSQFIKCPATGAGADCAKRFFFEFNFMTFPLMAGILFALLIVLYVYILKLHKD